MLNLCDFKLFYPKDAWRFGKGKNPPRGMGEPSGPSRIVRCPQCNKRLHLKAMYCVGGEFVCWDIPDHKAKMKETKKSPKRKSRKSGRGK